MNQSTTGRSQVLGIVAPTPQDEWNSSTEYQKLNIVRHNGAAYMAKQQSKNVEPSQSPNNYWMFLVGDGGGGSGTDGKPALIYSATINGTQVPSTGLSLTLPLSGFNRSDIATGETLQAPLYSYNDKSYYVTATVTSVESPNVVVSVVGFVDTTGATGAQGAVGENGENGQDGLPGLSFLYSTADSSTSVPMSSFDTTYGMPIPGDLVSFGNGDVRRVTNVGTISDPVTLSDVLYSIKGAQGSAGTNGADGTPYLLYTPVIAGTKVPAQDDELMLDSTGFVFAGGGDYPLSVNTPFLAIYQYNNISYLIIAIIISGEWDEARSGPTAKIADFVRISGENGSDGATPNISITATVDDNVGTPSVDVTKSGTDEAPQFNLAFHNLKGTGGSGGGNIPVVNNGTSNTTATIQPNTLYIWGEVTRLNITLATPTDNNILNEYHFFFESGDTATTLLLPNTVLWDEEPVIFSNTKYEVIITNNCAKIIAYYDNNNSFEIANVTLTGEEETNYYEVSGFEATQLFVSVLLPKLDTSYRFLISPNSQSHNGYMGMTSTSTKEVYYARFNCKTPTTYCTAGSASGTNITGFSWMDYAPAIINRQTLNPVSKFTSIKIGYGDAMNSAHLPAGTIIQIFGKKYPGA